METCLFCMQMKKDELKYILMEDEHAIAFLSERPFRKGNCTVAVKRHIKSISKLTDAENTSVARMISVISKALENVYKADKTYLISISDQVKHLHYHLIPKLDGQVSMGVYCFNNLVETEGVCEPTLDELNNYTGELHQFINNSINK